MIITVQYAGTCASCGEPIERGARAHYESKTLWCRDCPAPRSLRHDRKAQRERQRLGLEPVEFGKAPLLRDDD